MIGTKGARLAGMAPAGRAFCCASLKGETGILMAEQRSLLDTAHAKTVRGTERPLWLRFASSHDLRGGWPLTSIKDDPAIAWFGTIGDVFPDGITLSTSQRFASGATLLVELSAKPTQFLRLPVRVLHATRDKDRWVIRCAFARPLSEEERHAFLEE